MDYRDIGEKELITVVGYKPENDPPQKFLMKTVNEIFTQKKIEEQKISGEE